MRHFLPYLPPTFLQLHSQWGKTFMLNSLVTVKCSTPNTHIMASVVKFRHKSQRVRVTEYNINTVETSFRRRRLALQGDVY